METVILELLRGYGELYGLDMIAKRPDVLKRGLIYVTLDQMEERGLVASREVSGNPPRRKYRLADIAEPVA